MIETDDFLADLEAHLHDAAEREAARRAPRRARELVRFAVPALAVAALVALAVAVLPLHASERPVQSPTPTPTATASPPPAVAKRAAEVVRQAGADTAKRPSCRFTHPGKARLVDGTPLPAITAALPALATPARDAAATVKRVPYGESGPILRSSIHALSFGKDLGGLVYVTQGRQIPVADPAACGRARAALITARSAGAVRAAALAQLVSDPVVSPDAQTLVVQYGHALGPFASVGIPLAPGGQLPLGVIVGGGSNGERIYVAIADPRAVTVRAGTMTAKVRDGLYAFRNPPASVFEELDAAGKVLRRDRER